jgi:hypothetical protein
VKTLAAKRHKRRKGRDAAPGVRNPPFLNASLLLRFFVVKPDSGKLFSPQTSLPRQNRVMAGRKKTQKLFYTN